MAQRGRDVTKPVRVAATMHASYARLAEICARRPGKALMMMMMVVMMIAKGRLPMAADRAP